MITCFACGSELELLWPDEPTLPPQCHDAVMFKASGNYGSTVYDPAAPGRQSPEHLLINVCDGCLIRRADRVTLVKERIMRPRLVCEPWRPEVRDDT